MHFDTKIAVVLREDLLTWQKLNVTALAVTTDAKLSVYTAELFSTPHDEANRAAVKGQRKKLMDRLLKGLRLHP